MRLLIVGGGSIGERQLRCFLKAGRKLNIEICEPRAKRRRRLAAGYPVVAAHGDFEKLDPTAFDAAVIATPANLHVPQARRLLAAGCHVLIEKPLSVTGRGAASLVKLAGRKRRVAGVAYTYRSYPALVKMAEMVRRGRLGPPLAARVTMAYDYPLYRPDYRKNYFANPETGGGAVMDIASHAVAYLTGVLGPVGEVSCSAGRLGVRGVAVEDTALLALRFGSGALGEIWASAWQPRRRTEIEIFGPKGQLRYRSLFDEKRVELAFNPGDRGRAKRRGGFYGAGRRWKPLLKGRGKRFDADEPFVSQAKNFLAAVAGRERVRATLREALHVGRVCRAALRSAKTGRRLAVK